MIKKEDILLYESDKEDLIQIKKKDNNFYDYPQFVPFALLSYI